MVQCKPQICHFFIPEIQKIEKSIDANKFESQFTSQITVTDDFEEKRHHKENDSPLCELIRHDSIHEFVKYMNLSNLSFKLTIQRSIFESNIFLDENETSLIECAAFFGAAKIFKFLASKGAELTPFLWLCAIHSGSSYLLHFLKDDGIQPPGDIFDECVSEAMKCHHNDIARYIINNFNSGNREFVVSLALKHHNYEFFPENFCDNSWFFYLCCYIKMRKDEVKKEINQNAIKSQFVFE